MTAVATSNMRENLRGFPSNIIWSRQERRSVDATQIEADADIFSCCADGFKFRYTNTFKIFFFLIFITCALWFYGANCFRIFLKENICQK